jgi:dihydrofolate reductase
MEARIVRPPFFACVVAADEERGIGRKNHLPWPRLKGDLAHFKRITSETREAGARNAVIVGRRTWDSIPQRYRPLPGRLNVVVSRTTPRLPPEVLSAESLDTAIATAAPHLESLYVIGGGQLFEAAVADQRCEGIYYTRIAAVFSADTHFPAFEAAFVRESVDRAHHEAGVSYQIEFWRRRR